MINVGLGGEVEASLGDPVKFGLDRFKVVFKVMSDFVNVLSLFNPGAHGFLNVVNRMRKSEFVEHLNVLKRFSIGGLYI